MRLFDTHVHLLDERFDADRGALCQALPEAGVARALEACTEAGDIPRIRALVAMYPYLYGSAGIHPHEALTASNESLSAVRAALSEPGFVAVGEIGLDYHYDFAPREAQRAAFDAQLAIACEKNAPVIIHDREAHGDTLDLLRAYKGRLRGELHCFSGSYEFARECVDMGLYIAFGGALTFKNAPKQRDAAARLPLDALLVETDCPYMTPEPHRGTRNEPALVRLVVQRLAEIRGEEPARVAEATFENGSRLFGLA